MVAHEERGEPHTDAGKQAKRWAKVIMQVQGLKVTISGRCPGGEIIISDKSKIYH